MSRTVRRLLPLLAGALLSACARHPGPAPMAVVDRGWDEVGEASWYGPGFHGNRTASGEVYDMEQLTAAHRELPFGTRVRVQNLDNGRETEVRVNDRGPFARGRIIDLSRAAARAIGMLGSGTARVRIEVLEARETVTARTPRGEVTVPDGCWLVQVGAFAERRNAAETARQFEARGETVRQVPGDDGITRVLVGPFDSTMETRLTLEKYGGLLRPCVP